MSLKPYLKPTTYLHCSPSTLMVTLPTWLLSSTVIKCLAKSNLREEGFGHSLRAHSPLHWERHGDSSFRQIVRLGSREQRGNGAGQQLQGPFPHSPGTHFLQLGPTSRAAPNSGPSFQTQSIGASPIRTPLSLPLSGPSEHGTKHTPTPPSSPPSPPTASTTQKFIKQLLNYNSIEIYFKCQVCCCVIFW